MTSWESFVWALALQFFYFRNGNSEKQRKDSGKFAVLSLAEPLESEDSRGERPTATAT
jgi:hypothetical protein